MTELKCPFCGKPLLACIYNQNDIIYCCDNQDCVYHDDADNPKAKHYLATPEFWQALADTKKKLDRAIRVIQEVSKMSDKLSIKYGDTLVEQLDTIQAFCWEQGYILTHDEDFKRAEQIKDNDKDVK